MHTLICRIKGYGIVINGKIFKCIRGIVLLSTVQL